MKKHKKLQRQYERREAERRKQEEQEMAAMNPEQDSGQSTDVNAKKPSKNIKAKKGKVKYKEIKEKQKLDLRRTAKEAKKSAVIRRVLMFTAVTLVMVVAIMYLVSYFYDKMGSFTIKVNKYDMARQGITLSETKDIKNPKSRLQADIKVDMYNISGKDLPKDLNDHDGRHNGDNYIAYTFYLANSGSDTVAVKYSLNMSKITKNVDSAIRVRLYEDGKATDYAKSKTNGKPEAGTTPFPGAFVAANGVIDTFSPGDIRKYTVVIWLEGDDPDCINDIIGGSMKFDMSFDIFESS